MVPTYPEKLAVPASITDEQLWAAAKFRSKARLPVLTWKRKNNPAVITRCAQPLVGLNNSRSAADEHLMESILSSNPRSNTLHILDLRPKAASVANQTIGGGYEHNKSYPNCDLQFLGIDNIHAIRESFEQLSEIYGKSKHHKQTWLKAIEGSDWLKYTRRIIYASSKVIKFIEKDKLSVVLHCSDGWDRTAQVSAIAQLCLDYYFRTFEGFAILIEKEWLRYGHKFAERCGHSIDKTTSTSERSPIFVQFLDCVSQLLHQFPCSFEFNNDYLVFIAEHLYSCRFGTFLYDAHKERMDNGVMQHTVSIWSFLNMNKKHYLNSFYVKNKSVLWPSHAEKDLRFWDEYCMRWCSVQEEHEDPLVSLSMKLHKLEKKMRSLKSNVASVRKEKGSSPKIDAIEKTIEDIFSDISRFHCKKQHQTATPDMLNTGARLTKVGTSKSPVIVRATLGSPNWVPDGWVKSCHSCKKQFSRVKRKHHCRHCGMVFCDSCTSKRFPIEKFKISKPARVCDNCALGLLHEQSKKMLDEIVTKYPKLKYWVAGKSKANPIQSTKQARTPNSSRVARKTIVRPRPPRRLAPSSGPPKLTKRRSQTSLDTGNARTSSNTLHRSDLKNLREKMASDKEMRSLLRCRSTSNTRELYKEEEFGPNTRRLAHSSKSNSSYMSGVVPVRNSVDGEAVKKLKREAREYDAEVLQEVFDDAVDEK
eukprot:CAMPEP_0168517434 /NCGR_PEP_ID=MMETSP0405-20121227/6034_1 /TAXON_ID=498012 /ORGANISM="Trichosphaerium sp, Strain Am-I-7 wt" /LENGTH=702 /DNA_ID=CAMNT_0008537413 /DNA_START=295 /DNA_END=2403 /DNA_ORIENTATION=-